MSNTRPEKYSFFKLKDRLVDSLIRLEPKMLIAIGVVSAIVFSEIIALAIDILWDGKMSSELLSAAFITPLLDALIVLIFFVAIIARLKDALSKVKLLSGFLPICSSCKKIRDDKGYWSQIESYIRDHSEAEFSHGICPDCAKKVYSAYTED
jgi:hypothetical protein